VQIHSNPSGTVTVRFAVHYALCIFEQGLQYSILPLIRASSGHQ
jgi:hypothetical protein